jgi:glycosyltransferase involved in cell wall biosynthesis
MLKERLAYIDYWSHQSTNSGDFLREILSEEFEIVNFWWKPNEKIPIEEINKFDHMFFFHAMFPYQIMKKFRNKKIMWAPMYDALNFRNQFFESIFWKQMSSLGIKVLKFSNKITKSINNEDIESLKLNYFIKPNFLPKTNEGNKINIFFWDRGRIQIKDWLYLFDKKDLNEIVYFPNPDPGIFKIKENNLNQQKKYNIKYINKKFLPKNEYLKIFEKCNVFIAPRKKEGIGLTVVEAISKGMFIVGYDDATMNEYISDERVGFIYNEKTLKKVNSNNVVQNYEYRKKNAELNYNKWAEGKKKLFHF